MGIFTNFRNAWRAFWGRAAPGNKGLQMMQQYNGVALFNGTMYDSDIVRATIRPYVKAMGKLEPKHLRTRTDKDGNKTVTVNPDPYMVMLQKEPNPYMTGQKFREWMATQLAINGNAFAAIYRDDNGIPIAKYPILATSVYRKFDDNGILYLSFTLRNGKLLELPYSEVIHLRGDFGEANDLFGASPVQQVLPLLEVVGASDKSIVSAVKNSSIIRWLLNFHNAMRPEDLQKYAKDFAEQYLSSQNGTGVAAVDSKADAEQIKNYDYVPANDLTTAIVQRIRQCWNTNEKIVNSSYTEDEWNAYYENVIRPDVQQISDVESIRLLTRRQRALGDEIVYESENLSTASMKTKLSLEDMVDRGAMTPNEWRSTMNLDSVPGGDELIRRLDTAAVTDTTHLEGGDE